MILRVEWIGCEILVLSLKYAAAIAKMNSTYRAFKLYCMYYTIYTETSDFAAWLSRIQLKYSLNKGYLNMFDSTAWILVSSL